MIIAVTNVKYEAAGFRHDESALLMMDMAHSPVWFAK